MPKKHNAERYFQTNHGTFATNYTEGSEIRKKKVCELKLKISAQQSVFVRPVSKSKNATTNSFKIPQLLEKKEKPFQDDELLKEAFLTGAESLFDEFSNKSKIINAIQDLQLSDSTVLRRIEATADDMQSQLKRDLEKCEWFSLQFDESTDISDTSQLAVMIRMLFNDFSVKAELFKILPLMMRTRRKDIYNVFKTSASEIGLPLKKLSPVTTDGAPAITGRTECFLNFMSYHCIIHQEALCAEKDISI
ncbi:zinc finger BED domain-containing protein 5-like [Stegodyphus dumicola]|uniref:zinc finger BED domain-containing protein 5-like n=1 Tax=Stegodyphus dumicola TaxID=202533 RepID=UPI0015AEA92C|nr:zinc finger BED domain-containing protein 5-like [Stegodyphus dumicola]